MNPTRALASAAVACLLAVPAHAAPDAATRRLLDAGHWKQARAILEPRVKANPSDAEAAALLSRVRQAFGSLDAALPLAETAVTLEPNVADYHWRLAEVVGQMAQRASVFKQIGLGRRFRQEAETAMKLDARHLDSRAGMISFYIQAPGIVGGDRKKADQLAEEIARIDPAAGFLARARVLVETKTAGDVEGLYRQAAEAARTPELKLRATALLMNAALNAAPARLAAAEQAARALITIDPHRAGAYAGLAIAYATNHRFAELDAALAEAEKAVPDNLGPYYQAARVLVVQGTDLPRAERYLRKYLTIEPEGGAPGHAQAHWRLGLALEKQGRKPEAVATLEQAAKLNPAFEEAKKDLKRLR
jgi:tetratricopeptide (TPR) repeat protein